MVLPIIAREAARIGVRYLAQGLNYQNRLITSAYSRPYLSRNVNRGVVKGIKHGLYAGGGFEFAKDFISVGVEQGSASVQPFYGKTPNTQYKTYSRSTVRSSRRCPTEFRRRKDGRRSRTSKYY